MATGISAINRFNTYRPLGNVTPFTYRDGLTYHDLLYSIRDYLTGTLPDEFSAEIERIIVILERDMSTLLDRVIKTEADFRKISDKLIAEVNAKINAINNKTGTVDIQRYTITGPYTLTVDPVWPNNHPVHIVITQGGKGGHAVTLAPEIKGQLAVESHAGGETRFTLFPARDGAWWEVFQVENLINARVRKAEAAAPHRAWIGGRVPPADGGPMNTGAAYFDHTALLESEMQAKFDIVSWYAAVNPNAVYRFNSEIIPELTRNPDRKVMYAMEIHRSNTNFLTEFDSKTGIYNDLYNLLLTIKESGFSDRMNLAPFHECNGPGGAYPWQMFDTSNGNSVEKFKECYKRVVGLARSLGLKSNFIQWFLTSNGGGADDNRNISKGFVGDEWVDLIGASYYNRATDGASETAVGGTLTRFVRHVEGMTSRNVWVCEAGCYPSLPSHDKGTWYSDLVTLAASNQMPRLEAVCLFMSSGMVPPAGKALENPEQKRRLGIAMNNARRVGDYGNGSDLTRNLLPRPIAVPSKASDWTVYKTDGLPDLKLSITSNVPNDVDAINTSLRVTKPYSNSISTDYRVYRPVRPGDVDFEINRVHTTGFWARASYDGFKLGFGVRQSGGNLVTGDSRIELSTQWEYYNSPFATGIASGSHWQMPHMTLGDNLEAGWFEITDMQISRGSHPTPDVSKVVVPRIKYAEDAPTITVNCESVDVFIIELSGDRLMNAPIGAAYDGQRLSIRMRQDKTGGRALNRSTDSRWWVSSKSLTNEISVAPFSQTLIECMYFADQDKWGITNVSRMNFT